VIYDGSDSDDLEARVAVLEKWAETAAVLIAELSAVVVDDDADEAFETQHQRMMSRRRMERASGV
jgi:D-lyxose ketol-isomerase